MVTSALFRLNGEKYLSFQVGNLRFMDSFQFLSTSLDNLVVSLLLKSGRDKFSHATKHLGDSDLVLQRESIHIRIRPDATNSQKPNSHRSRPFIILWRTNLAFRKTTIGLMKFGLTMTRKRCKIATTITFFLAFFC